MSFPRYPRYKDSGVEWLGQVPEHWEVKRLKRACHVFPSNVDKKTYDDETPVKITTNRDFVICEYPEGKLNGDMPKQFGGDNYFNKWHHYAIACKAGQLKISYPTNVIHVHLSTKSQTEIKLRAFSAPLEHNEMYC